MTALTRQTLYGDEMNPKEFIETPEQVGAKVRKRATGRVTNLPHEAQQALTADSPTNWALWRLSLVLKEISENLEPHGDEKQPLENSEERPRIRF
jgi:hypothetical protein